jgi:predicted acyltransferase
MRSSAPSFGPTSGHADATALGRRASIDVYRGKVMFLMLLEMLHLYKLAEIQWRAPFLIRLQEWGVWEWLGFSTKHVEWEGDSLHDMIQPSFSFLVGVSLPSSLAARGRWGQPRPPHHRERIAAHWNKNSNLGWAFVYWFLNLFLRDKPFQFNGGNCATLSFIPALATMVLGLIAGQWLMGSWPTTRWLGVMALVGLGCRSAAGGIDAMGLCPIVKKVWTPTFLGRS